MLQKRKQEDCKPKDLAPMGTLGAGAPMGVWVLGPRWGDGERPPRAEGPRLAARQDTGLRLRASGTSIGQQPAGALSWILPQSFPRAMPGFEPDAARPLADGSERG